MSSHSYLERHGIYGLMAEFEHPDELVNAAHRAFSAGYRNMEGYSPMPIEGLSDALGFKRHFVSLGGADRRDHGHARRVHADVVDHGDRLRA